jgi:hypothetical protein
MKRSLLLLGLAGCGSPSSTEVAAPIPSPTPPPTVAVASLPAKPTVPEPVPVALKPLEMPTDLGGRTVTHVLLPGSPSNDTFLTSATQKPRVSPLDSGELPLPEVPLKMPALPLPESKPVQLSPPKEVAPRDLGTNVPKFLPIQVNPRPLVKAPSVPNPGAGDVPSTARQLPDRASLEDPSAELSNAKVIVTPFPIPMDALPFFRITIPDPFEFAEQLKGKLPRVQEFGTAPATVNPERK